MGLGLGIHYIHKKSDVQNAIPLSFVHGCKEGAREDLQCRIDNILHRAWQFYRNQENPPTSRQGVTR